MDNNGFKFYQIFGFGGTVAVNGLSFSDLIMVNFGTLIVMILLFGLLAFLFPLLMLFMYIILLLVDNWEETQLNRVRVNILAIIGYIYFMIDYHFGFVGWIFFYTMCGPGFVEKLCYVNTGLFILNVLLIFFGNRIFNQIRYGIVRFAVFGAILFLSSKVLLPMGEALSPVIAKQYVPKPGDGILEEEDTTETTPQEEEIDGLDAEIEKFERGRGNYHYEYTQPNEKTEDIGRD